jgi:hypothetical protein
VSAGQAKQSKRQVARLGVLPRPLALVVLATWAVLTVVALVGLLRAPAIWSGSREGLIPIEHRAVRGQPLALLRVDHSQAPAQPQPPSGDPAPGAPTELDGATILADAGVAIEEALGRERVPLAPPRTEITRWLDAHALYLLPVDTHENLAEQLSDARMLAEVQGLQARLASPLFAVSGEQPRRDPLGIHELTQAQLGRLGHVAELPGGDDPRVSASGDLIAASGDRALIALRSDRPGPELLAELREAVAGLPVTVTLVDPSVDEAALATQLGAGPGVGARSGARSLGDAGKLTIAGFAALVLLLSLVMRRLVPVLAVAACLASVWIITMFGLVSVDVLGDTGGTGAVELGAAALALIALGFGCDAALRLPRIGVGGWASTLVTATALIPLLLTPYPLWQRWAVIWLVALLLTAGVMRLVLPVLLALLRGDVDWRQPGFRLVPMPALGVLLCVGLIAAGAWSSPQLRYRPGTRLPSAPSASALERELVEHFFDPSLVVTAESSSSAVTSEHPTPAAAALEAAAADVARLAELVPSEARRVDSPGSFVLAKAELERRQAALRTLKLSERMAALDQLLVDRGLRAEAFAEFVRGATNIDELPSAQAALDGPLGPWIAGYVHERAEPEASATLLTRVELRGREGLPSVAIPDERLAALPRLRGPAIAAMIDQRQFGDRAAVVVLSGLWLGAFLVWLGTGSFASSLAVSLVAAASEGGVLIGLRVLDQPIGPHLLPILILVGASATVSGGQACRAVSLGQPIAARGALLAGACQVAVGLVLLGSAQPLWRELGLALALGCALASGLGLFATPGLARLFAKLRPLGRGRPRPPEPAESGGPR